MRLRILLYISKGRIEFPDNLSSGIYTKQYKAHLNHLTTSAAPSDQSLQKAFESHLCPFLQPSPTMAVLQSQFPHEDSDTSQFKHKMVTLYHYLVHPEDRPCDFEQQILDITLPQFPSIEMIAAATPKILESSSPLSVASLTVNTGVTAYPVAELIAVAAKLVADLRRENATTINTTPSTPNTELETVADARVIFPEPDFCACRVPEEGQMRKRRRRVNAENTQTALGANAFYDAPERNIIFRFRDLVKANEVGSFTREIKRSPFYPKPPKKVRIDIRRRPLPWAEKRDLYPPTKIYPYSILKNALGVLPQAPPPPSGIFGFFSTVWTKSNDKVTAENTYRNAASSPAFERPYDLSRQEATKRIACWELWAKEKEPIEVLTDETHPEEHFAPVEVQEEAISLDVESVEREVFPVAFVEAFDQRSLLQEGDVPTAQVKEVEAPCDQQVDDFHEDRCELESQVLRALYEFVATAKEGTATFTCDATHETSEQKKKIPAAFAELFGDLVGVQQEKATSILAVKVDDQLPSPEKEEAQITVAEKSLVQIEPEQGAVVEETCVQFSSEQEEVSREMHEMTEHSSPTEDIRVLAFVTAELPQGQADWNQKEDVPLLDFDTLNEPSTPEGPLTPDISASEPTGIPVDVSPEAECLPEKQSVLSLFSFSLDTSFFTDSEEQTEFAVVVNTNTGNFEAAVDVKGKNSVPEVEAEYDGSWLQKKVEPTLETFQECVVEEEVVKCTEDVNACENLGNESSSEFSNTEENQYNEQIVSTITSSEVSFEAYVEPLTQPLPGTTLKPRLTRRFKGRCKRLLKKIKNVSHKWEDRFEVALYKFHNHFHGRRACMRLSDKSVGSDEGISNELSPKRPRRQLRRLFDR